MQAEGESRIMTSPRENSQDHNIFISLTSALYVIVKSRKEKSKALKKEEGQDIVSRGFDTRMEEIQEEHKQETTQLQKAITDRDNQMQAIQY